ncbi:type I methionyl aminopeptidase [Brevibacterium sp. 5221]|uniref:Methionine aminopeptidase n=1 Tax=Brevibacterium rongguiense TaxID=2695267 RepID=A0A6N9H6L4_9MICO|nr:type I methionyl aminopeptidase [Brevibacterium rongguiense]MYM19396.1 type I methionyl aminopeptidase [Brevibacterium rongguiense]
MIELKTPAEIEKMAVTGRFVAHTLRTLAERAEPGVDVMDLEHEARRMVKARGAESCYWDYAPAFGSGPFRNVICLSVNDAALHGKPRPHVLALGDLLSLDFAVSIDGWVADAAVSVVVGADAGSPAGAGVPDADASAALIASTRDALDAGIAAAVPGGRLGDVSAAIGAVGRSRGYRINTDFGGHGLGRTMHGEPHVPNQGRAGKGLKIQPGLTIAIEPWWGMGTDELAVDGDGWTLRMADGKKAAHTEHTIAVTEDGPRILTLAE